MPFQACGTSARNIGKKLQQTGEGASPAYRTLINAFGKDISTCNAADLPGYLRTGLRYIDTFKNDEELYSNSADVRDRLIFAARVQAEKLGVDLGDLIWQESSP